MKLLTVSKQRHATEIAIASISHKIQLAKKKKKKKASLYYTTMKFPDVIEILHLANQSFVEMFL